MTRIIALLSSSLLLVLVAGCGSSSSGGKKAGTTPAATKPAPAAPAPAAAVPPGLAAAMHPRVSDFPAVRGRTLTELTRGLKPVGEVGPAVGTFVPGPQRFAFELLDARKQFVYAPTAVYIARTPSSPAQGPFLAPADSLLVPAQFRSKTGSGGDEPPGVLAAQIPIPKAGRWSVLTVTRKGGKLLGGATQIAARASSPIPGPGDPAPRIDTLTSGKLSLLTTRIPPESMHSVSASAVIGRKPVALLFSTPALCMSRICGPVTDVVVALQPAFRDRITFIHQEVYAENNPVKGYRPQMKAYHLETEPWLFTIDRRGKVAARLEGAFGRAEVAAALKAALR